MDNQYQNQNQYVICPNCNQCIPYGSTFCNKCGCQLQYPQQLQYQQQYYNMVQPAQQQPKKKRKDSPLSVVAGLIALVGFIAFPLISFMGFILAIIDIAVGQSKEDDNYIHACSWFAVFVFLFYIVAIFLPNLYK